MANNKTAKRILKYDLCIGCGLCSSIFSSDICKMHISGNGFYRPDFKGKVDEHTLRHICPGIRVHDTNNHDIWGKVKEVIEGWSKDEKLRYKAASGGVVSSLAIYMLESGKADAVLQVGVKEDSYLYNELKLSRSKDDIIKNAQSRYAPALTLVNIKQILDESDDRYVFIGKPCDIAGIRNLIELYPIYKERFVLLISIFCAGIPSYQATERAWKLSGRDDSPKSLKYRGEGWPGYFRATWKDGESFELSYDESWGKILGRQLGFRCKICPDGIGMLADIAVGDSWSTQNGYPDFTESDGRCFIFVRTDRGKNILDSASRKNYLECHDLSIDRIHDMQRYQFDRRKLVGWRLIPVWIATKGLVDFKGLSIIKQAKSAAFKDAISNIKGSAKRMMKIAFR